MTETVVVALITAAGGVLSGVMGKVSYDKMRNGRGTGHYVVNGNGNGNSASVESALARRAEVEFQTRMTVLMEQLTAAIEKGHDKAVDQMQAVSEAIADAAGAIRGVHKEIVEHRVASSTAMTATLDTHRLVKEMHRVHNQPRGNAPPGGKR